MIARSGIIYQYHKSTTVKHSTVHSSLENPVIQRAIPQIQKTEAIPFPPLRPKKPFSPLYKPLRPTRPLPKRQPMPLANANTTDPWDIDSFLQRNTKNTHTNSRFPLQKPQEIQKPQEYYKGLPVEETPEIDISLPPPTVDTSFVDRLFGEASSLPTQTAKTQELQKEEAAHTTAHVSNTPDTTASVASPHGQQQGEKQTKRTAFDLLKPLFGRKKTVGTALILIACTGIFLPFIPRLRLEATYAEIVRTENERILENQEKPLPPAIPIGVNPMTGPDGKEIEPINKEFSIIIPAVGINAPIIAGVDPLSPQSYKPALEKGVAHARTSYLPGGKGTTFLFSHSTNYEWYVKDLNAIFYNVKNLQPKDYIILFYKGTRYVYEYTGKEIVKPSNTYSLVPETGKNSLILQTCWPPGSTTERLLIHADLVQTTQID